MASIFLLTRELLSDIGLSEYQVGFRGSLGASFVAFLCGICCINPIEAVLQPEFFEDIVKTIALSHGAAVWDDNAERLLKELP